MMRLTFLIVVCLLGNPFASAQTYWPTPQQWQALGSQSAHENETRQVLAAQRRLADAAMRTPPGPLETLRSAGRLAGDPVKAATAAALKDMAAVSALAVTYAVSGEPRYAERAGDYLDAWAQINRPSGQPIDETGLEPGIFGYGIVRDALSGEQRQRIDAWLRAIADAEIAARDGRKRTAINNWHSHRLKTVGLIGVVLSEARFVDYARRGLRAQIADNLRPDGSSLDFLERDALAYHVYDLRPLVTLALAFAPHGEDDFHWQAANGASIARSVAWLKPYLHGEKKHAEFVNSSVAFDKARSDNQERGHVAGHFYDVKDALPLLDLAAAFDCEYAALARQLASAPRLRAIIGAARCS